MEVIRYVRGDANRREMLAGEKEATSRAKRVKLANLEGEIRRRAAVFFQLQARGIMDCRRQL